MNDGLDLSSIFDEVQGILSGKDVALERAVSSMLSDDEIHALLLSFSYARDSNGFTEEEAQSILDWALRVRVDNTLLELVLKRVTLIDINENGEILSKLSPYGEDLMRK